MPEITVASAPANDVRAIAATVAPSLPEGPLHTIKRALAWAIAEGIPVDLTVPHRGLACVSNHARRKWERDPGAKAVDVIGACMLLAQDEGIDLGEHLECAQSAAVSGSIPLSEGILDGSEGGPPSEGFLKSAARLLYLQGYQLGILLRQVFHRPPQRHVSDADCVRAHTLDIAGNCFGCGAVAGEPCPTCHGERYHGPHCTAVRGEGV
jgi:hypothetical protein